MVAADGGANALIAAGISPIAIVGDLDSFDPSSLPTGWNGSLIRIEDQDTTDVEKALRYALEVLEANDVILTGTHSMEMDHVLGTLSVCARYAHRCRLGLVESELACFFVADNLELVLLAGSRVSLMGIGQATGITTTGLRWPLTDVSLALGERDGIRNEATGSVSIRVNSGCLGVFLPRDPTKAFVWPVS